MTASETVVVAQGTFDILHPGHVHYLQQSAALGDHLEVIVARSSNVTHKEPPVIPDEQRRKMVDALAVVDTARLGHSADIFVPIEAIQPDVITLGHDQHFDEASIRAELEAREISCRVERVEALTETEGLYSTGRIIDEVLRRYTDQD